MNASIPINSMVESVPDCKWPNVYPRVRIYEFDLGFVSILFPIFNFLQINFYH